MCHARCGQPPGSGPSLDDLVSSLNVNQTKQVKSHLEHQVMHESGTCKRTVFKPMYM